MGFDFALLARSLRLCSANTNVKMNAAKAVRGLPQWNNSNERKLSPPGIAASPSESSLECIFHKASLPRSGGDCVIVGTG